MSQRKTKPLGESVVEWPHELVSSSNADKDLGPPLAQLLVDLGIKGTPGDQLTASKASSAVSGTPFSVSIIEAGATAASKGWTTLIAALGGATAVWAAATNFWNGQPAPTRGALVIGAAVVVAACALGAALIMYGDVRARGQGAAAQYYARASVASAFLQGATTVAGTAVTAPNGRPSANGAKSKAAGQDGTVSAELKTAIEHEIKKVLQQTSHINQRTQKNPEAAGASSEDKRK